MTSSSAPIETPNSLRRIALVFAALACAPPVLANPTIIFTTPGLCSLAGCVRLHGAPYLTIGADGLGLIVYSTFNNIYGGVVQVVHCDDVACSTVRGNGVAVGLNPEAAIGADGRALLVHGQTWSIGGSMSRNTVEHCEDAACSSQRSTSAPFNNAQTALNVPVRLAIGADGLPIIAFRDQDGLRIAHCSDVLCNSATSSPLASAASPLAIRTGADGLPLVLFSDAQGLHVGHCNDHLCGTATTVALGTGSAGSLAIGSDGLGIIAYGDKLARCTDLSCSSVTTAALEPIGTVQAVHIGAFGLPIVTGVAGGKIKRAFCNDVSCTTASVFEMDTGASGPVGGVSWASGQDGRPLVSYIETVDSNATIKVFHCPDALCLPPRTLSIASASVMEGAASDSATLTFLATLSEPVPVEVTVDFMTSDGTASGAVDYLPASGTLTFAPGITSRLVSVAVRGDADYEADESLRVVLSNPVNARLGTETATGTIANDDSPPTVRILNAAGVEGNYGSSLLPVTVELSAPSFQEVSVQYATADVSAQAGTDYFAASGTLRIAPGERKATIGLAVKADREREPDEWLTVRLSNPAGAGLAKSNGDVRILDDDSRPWPGADFDGDFKTDILWREAGNARSYVWLMESRGLKARGYTTKDAWSDWQFLAAGDLNGDGRADLLWRNSQTGQLYVWLMDAFQVNDGSGYTASQADLSWKVEGLGDLDGDGRQDIVWRAISGPARGALFVWLMDATRIKDATYLHPIAEDWAIQRIGDFTGDGRADILWRNITPGVPDAGNLYLWVMNGAQVVSGSGYTNSQADFSWRIETTGDLDANGTQDIIWRAVSGPAQGALFVWLMDGRMVRGATYLDPISTDWQIVGTGDFNGDGTADILWRNFGVGAVDRGLLYFWMMNGPRVVAGTGYGVTNADLTWELKAPR